MIHKTSKIKGAVAWALATVLTCCFSSSLFARALPEQASLKHLGVGSCSSSQCHGSIKQYKDSNIARNEYRIWEREDAHSSAYDVLKNSDSKLIAKKLKLSEPAHQAKICLDCHADHVPQERRGKKFQISDGIGCEACHGGGELWIESHTEDNATHEDNLAKGMYPTENPQDRAKLCLSCHYGTSDKFATHDIMAAGHPRLSFELDTFTITQEHYQIDDDYRQRKKTVNSVKTWAIGQIQAGIESANVLAEYLKKDTGVFPELSMFDCHACHHPMDDKRWRSRTTTALLPVGAIRISEAYVAMLLPISKIVAPAENQKLIEIVQQLQRATLHTKEQLITHANELSKHLSTVMNAVNEFEFGDTAIGGIRTELLTEGIKGELRDYVAAEQATMALDLLSFALGQDELLAQDIDALYEALQNDANFNPALFIKRLANLSARVKQASK